MKRLLSGTLFLVPLLGLTGCSQTSIYYGARVGSQKDENDSGTIIAPTLEKVLVVSWC